MIWNFKFSSYNFLFLNFNNKKPGRLAPAVRVGLTIFVVIKLPEDGTLVQKHVEAGNEHRLCFVICVLLNVSWCIVLVNVLKTCVCYK